MVITVTILAQGTSWAVAVTQASFTRRAVRDVLYSNALTLVVKKFHGARAAAHHV